MGTREVEGGNHRGLEVSGERKWEPYRVRGGRGTGSGQEADKGS